MTTEYDIRDHRKAILRRRHCRFCLFLVVAVAVVVTIAYVVVR